MFSMSPLLKLRLVGPALRSTRLVMVPKLLWLDNWHPIGSLYKILGDNVVRTLGNSLLSNLSSIVCNDESIGRGKEQFH